MMTALTILDLLILGGLTIGIWRGTRTGAVRQVAGIVGIIAAFWMGALFMHPAGELLVALSGVPEDLGPLAGFLCVAVIVLAVVAAVALIGRKTLSVLKLGFLDRGLGGVFGGMRIAVVLSLLLLISSAPALPGSGGLVIGMDTRESSVLYGPVRSVAPALWEGFRSMAPGWHDSLLDRFGPIVDAGESDEG